MHSYLLHTHVWAWDLKIDLQLPARIMALMDDADDVFVSVISFYEITQKARLGK
jgi:PIN domain nuclease of toxin-antitoxin system